MSFKNYKESDHDLNLGLVTILCKSHVSYPRNSELDKKSNY